jgi:membrane fusion protein (multidrug efflux system)
MKVFLCARVAVTAAVPAAPAQERIEAVTRPSKDAVLSFVMLGKIEEVLVKEGDAVTAGQVIMRQDDTVEQAQMAQLKAEAEDDTRLKAADAQLAQKKVDLRKTEEAHREGAATALEVDHARLDVTISQLSLELAQFERKQAKLKYEQVRLQVERMKLLSPIDGVVERLLVDPGEVTEAAEKIAQIVQIDPLWIDVPVPLAQARTLSKDNSGALVEFESADPTKRLAVEGKVIHIAGVADSASGTLTVRVECANKTRRPAGEHVFVSFTQKVASGSPK